MRETQQEQEVNMPRKPSFWTCAIRNLYIGANQAECEKRLDSAEKLQKMLKGMSWIKM